ncbi:hypothetical protein [Paracoccus sp. ME4]|uniref:hypothetical protein n=1 Tax=Paracoccus sp. ME4 TaxID=3138066 RepID=UPI00398A9E1B
MAEPISIIVDVFEDRYPIAGAERPPVADPLIAWFRAAVAAIDADVLPIEATGTDPDMPREIELLLCSAETMEYALGSDALGLHVVETPGCDSFGDETPYARRMRCVVVIDPDDIRSRLREEILADGEAWQEHLQEYEESEAATAFHELAHAVLFAANSGWVSPNKVELLYSAGALNNDLFDHSSGYGMRPLPDEDGCAVWADDAAHAAELMEAWCERQGRAWYRQAAASQTVGFYAALGLDPSGIAREALDEDGRPAPGS